MKPESVEIVDFEMRKFRKGLRKIILAADKLGFVGITEEGRRVSYLVSAKFWRTGVLDSDAITGITGRGKLIAYVVPVEIWDLALRLLGAFTPAGRRRLPGIARAAALRDAREAKALKKQSEAAFRAAAKRGNPQRTIEILDRLDEQDRATGIAGMAP